MKLGKQISSTVLIRKHDFFYMKYSTRYVEQYAIQYLRLSADNKHYLNDLPEVDEICSIIDKFFEKDLVV